MNYSRPSSFTFAVVNDNVSIIWDMGGDDNQRHLLVADPEDLKLGNHHSQLSANKLTFETITVPIDRILIFPKRVYVLSQACYENLGPWGKDVYYHTGALPIRNDDANDFLFYCHTVRKLLTKGMKPGKFRATVKVPTSISQFNALWDPFHFVYCKRSIPQGAMNFTPDPQNITECERMLVYGFTKKAAAADRLLNEYRENQEPIPLTEGRVNTLKRKLASMIEQDSTDPALKHVKVEKSGALPFGIYSRGLDEKEIDQLIATLGPVDSKYMKIEKSKFNVVFNPSKFQATITFTFQNKTTQ